MKSAPEDYPLARGARDMFHILQERQKQGHRTAKYPLEPPTMPDRFRGLPILDTSKCADGCKSCAEACPTHAIQFPQGNAVLDMGRCLFCGDCQDACPDGAVSFSSSHQLASGTRDGLLVTNKTYDLGVKVAEKTRQLFGRSLFLRVVSAAGCNACEADVNVLTTVVFDLSRFGIQYVASPRQADGLLITGPVSQNMKLALRKTYDAVPTPKLVIAVGACAISGGPYLGHEEACDGAENALNSGADSVIPVDLYIPGCPPHPWTILDGFLRLLGRLEHEPRPAAT